MPRSRTLKAGAAALLALAALALAAAAKLVEREQAAFERSVQAEARALLDAADARVEGELVALGVLAASPGLDTGDFAAFRQQAERMLAERPAWRAIELYSPSGEPLDSAIRGIEGPGAALPGERELVQHAAATLRSQIGDLFPGATEDAAALLIAVPAVREGIARYVVVARLAPPFLGMLLRTPDLPGAWEVALLDRQGRALARLPGAAPRAAAPPYTAQRRSSYTGWSVVLAAPAASLDSEVAVVPWLLAACSAVLALASFAWILARPARPKPQAPANDPAPVSRAVVRPAGAERRRRSVLAAASDPEVRRALVLAFGSQENRVYAAADGAEALALSHDIRPDVALLDLRLPRVSGYELAKQLRYQYGRTVWLVALGGRDPEDRLRALAAGFDEHLGKPLTQEALDALLRMRAGRAAGR